MMLSVMGGTKSVHSQRSPTQSFQCWKHCEVLVKIEDTLSKLNTDDAVFALNRTFPVRSAHAVQFPHAIRSRVRLCSVDNNPVKYQSQLCYQ